MRVLYISLVVIFIDQVTKLLVKGLNFGGLNWEGMPYGSSKQVLGDFLKITFIENPGMAFGINIGPKMFLTVFTIIASMVILYYIYKHRNDTFILRLALAFILAGAVGNLIDRTFYGVIYGYAPIFYGRVVDFIQVETWDFTIFGRTYSTWPIFNVADISVTVGFLIILFFHNRIFKQEDELAAEQAALDPAVNDADGSSIENVTLVEERVDKSLQPESNDADGSNINDAVIVQPPVDQIGNNVQLIKKDTPENKTVSETTPDNDSDGSSIDEPVIGNPLDEEKNINTSAETKLIENKKKNTHRDPPGSEETKS